MRQADFVLAVGTRLGDVTTEGYTLLQPPRPQATLIHVYPDANEIGRVYQPDLAIVASMTEFAAAVKTLEPLDWMAWGDWVKGARYDYLETLEVAESPGNMGIAAPIFAQAKKKHLICFLQCDVLTTIMIRDVAQTSPVLC